MINIKIKINRHSTTSRTHLWIWTSWAELINIESKQMKRKNHHSIHTLHSFVHSSIHSLFVTMTICLCWAPSYQLSQLHLNNSQYCADNEYFELDFELRICNKKKKSLKLEEMKAHKFELMMGIGIILMFSFTYLCCRVVCNRNEFRNMDDLV